MPSMDTVVTSLGNVRPHTRKVCEEIASRWTLYFIWGIGPSGEHAEGRALDFMTYRLGGGVNSPGPVRVELGWEIARWLWDEGPRIGTWYVIYRQKIISINNNSYGPAGQWNDMPDRGNPTANHMDHPHVSFVNSPPAYTPPSVPEPPEEDDMPLNDADKQWILDQLASLPRAVMLEENSASKRSLSWHVRRADGSVPRLTSRITGNTISPDLSLINAQEKATNAARLAEKIDAKIDAILDAVKDLDEVDADALAARVADAVERLDAEAVAEKLEIVVGETEEPAEESGQDRTGDTEESRP